MAGFQSDGTRTDTTEALAAWAEAERRDIRTTFKGKIVSYDPATQLATVKPLIKEKFGDMLLEAPNLEKVRVRHPQGGGYTAHFPLKAGNDVTLHAYERSHDAQETQGGSADWRGGRMHDLSDCVAVPGGGDDTNPMQNMPADGAHYGTRDGKRGLRANDDGTVDVRGGPDGAKKIKVDTDGKVDVMVGTDSLMTILKDVTDLVKSNSAALSLTGSVTAATNILTRIANFKAAP